MAVTKLPSGQPSSPSIRPSGQLFTMTVSTAVWRDVISVMIAVWTAFRHGRQYGCLDGRQYVCLDGRLSETAVSSAGRAVRSLKVLRRKAQTSHDERESSFTILQLATTILQPYYNRILQPHTTTPLPCNFVAKCNFHIFNNKNTYILLTRASKLQIYYKTAEK